MSSKLHHTQQVRILYKTILKLHRGLPEQVRSLGNNYVRDEFRRHKNCNSSETNIFMKEWAHYAISLAQQVDLKVPTTDKQLGKSLGEVELQQLRDEQVYQLYELMLATTGKRSEEKISET